jgi:hypothetical protein
MDAVQICCDWKCALGERRIEPNELVEGAVCANQLIAHVPSKEAHIKRGVACHGRGKLLSDPSAFSSD